MKRSFSAVLALAALGFASMVLAQAPADPAGLQQVQSTGAAIGKSLGMLLFGYLVLKLFNRPREGKEDKGRRWRIGGLLLLLLFMLGVWWFR